MRDHHFAVAGLIAWIAAALLLGVWISACGNSDGDTLSPAQRARYQALEQCTGLAAPEPRVDVEQARPCPTSGRVCCFGADMPCSHDASKRCAATGELRDRELIVVSSNDGVPPCGDVFSFEATRYLLCTNDNIDDACRRETGFSDPRWSCARPTNNDPH